MSLNQVQNIYAPDMLAELEPASHISEAIKMIRTNIEFSSFDKKLQIITITSSNQAEGKTAVISNLAVTYAQVGRKVLLIDADMRRPMVHKMFGLSSRRGLTNVLISGRDHQDFVLPTLTENLFVLPSGPIPPNPAEMLMSSAFNKLLAAVREDYDLILIDAPPVAVVTDAAIISTKVDGVVYVVRAHVVEKKQLAHATELLAKVKANVIGYVLNGVQEGSDSYQYYYQYYQEEQVAKPKTEKKRKKQKSKAKKAQAKRQPHHLRPLQLPDKDDGFINLPQRNQGISSEEE